MITLTPAATVTWAPVAPTPIFPAKQEKPLKCHSSELSLKIDYQIHEALFDFWLWFRHPTKFKDPIVKYLNKHSKQKNQKAHDLVLHL